MVPALALFDRMTFSIFAKLGGMPPGGLEHMVRSFDQRHWLVGWRRHRVHLRVPLQGGAATMEVCLMLSEARAEDGSAAVTIGSGSVAQLNGLRLLRADLGGAVADWVGLDGKDNVIGPTAATAHHLLPRQLELVSQALEALREGIDDALVGSAGAVEQELRLTAAEMTVDSRWPESRAFVYSLDRCPMPGSCRVMSDLYRSSTVGGFAPSKSWFEGKAKLYVKVYAKCEDLLRLELVIGSRAALEHLGSGVREVGGPEAAELLSELAALARGRLVRALLHVGAAQLGVRPMAVLLRELLPLADLAVGIGAKRGRPPERGAAEGANLALEALVATGHFNGRNLPEHSALWAALDKLSKGAGPLERANGNLYTVRPLVPRDALGGEAREAGRGEEPKLLAPA